MMERRYASLVNNIEDNNKYAIIPGDLSLAQDFLTTFFDSSNMLEISLRLIVEKDPNLRKFGIRQLRNYSDTLTKKTKLDKIFRQANFDDILSILLESEDLKEVFEVSWIALNFTENSTEFCCYLVKPDHIKQLFNRMKQINDLQVTNHFVYIFSNIISESQETHRQVTSLVEITPYVCNMLKTPNLPVFIKSTCIWVIGNISEHLNEEIIDLIDPLIEEIVKHTRSNINKDIFSEALDCLSKIVRSATSLQSDLIEAVIGCDLCDAILPYLSMTTDSFDLRNILCLIGNCAWASDDFIFDIYEDYGFEKFESMLEVILISAKSDETYIRKHTAIIKDLCWALGNICSVGQLTVRGNLIRKTHIPRYLLELYQMTTSKDIKVEVLEFFNRAVEGRDSNVKTEILSLKVLELFCEELNSDNNEIKVLCLDGLLQLMQYGKNIMREVNIVKVELDKNDIQTKIDALTNSQDEAVSTTSSKVLEFFNTDDVGGQS